MARIYLKNSISRDTKNSGKVFVLAVMCVLFFIFHIWTRTKAFELGFEIGAQRRDIQKLDSQISVLKVEKSKLLSPDNLDKVVARSRQSGINFTQPTKDQVYYLDFPSESPGAASLQ